MAADTKTKQRNGKTKRKTKQQKIDLTPSWEGHEDWNTDQFRAAVRNALYYYNLEYSGKDMKPKVIEWMTAKKYSKAKIKAFKATNDWRVSSTLGAICANLLRGMPPVREDYNHGKNVEVWVAARIEEIIEKGARDSSPKEETPEATTTVQLSVQDRLRNKAVEMSAELDAEYDLLISNPKKYDIKEFNPLVMLRGKECKAAHARIISAMFEKDLAEIEEVLITKDADLLEAYEHLGKAEKKKVQTFLKEIVGACSMLQQEGKVTRATRKKKPKSKDKLAEKLNYKKADEKLKIVSINPIDIVGANELWVYNCKTRKIGKYVAENQDPKNLGREGTGLSIKGTTIVGFDAKQSIQKTLRKPEQQLAEFKSSGKVKLRKFLDDIRAVDISLNGRINPDIILLKVER